MQRNKNANMGQCVTVHCLCEFWYLGNVFRSPPAGVQIYTNGPFQLRQGALGLPQPFPSLPFYPPSPARQERKCSQAQVSGIRLTLCQLTWENVRGKLKCYQTGGAHLRGRKLKREQSVTNKSNQKDV